MGINVDGAVDKMVTIMVFAFVGAALVPTVLDSFTNLSNSGIALSALFGSILGILLAVFIFRTLFKSMR